MDYSKGRLNIYLPNETLSHLRGLAHREHTTLSGYIAKLIDEKVDNTLDDLLDVKDKTSKDQILNMLKKLERSIGMISYQNNAIYRNVNYSSRLLTLGNQTKQGIDGKYITKPDEEIKRVARKKALHDYEDMITAGLDVEDYLDEKYEEESMIGITDGNADDNEILSQLNPSTDPVPVKRKGLDPNKYLKK